MTPTQTIEDALARHGSAVLELSGGKDSLCVLHHARLWADRITVMFVDMGDMFDHVRPFVERVCDLWDYKLEVIESAPPAGAYPADIVPVWSTPFGGWFLPEKSKPQTQIISGLDCCNVTLWQPLQNAVIASGTSLVLRGSKETDEHISVHSGTVIEGIEYLNPVAEWTDTEVMFYLQDHGVELPKQYGLGVNHSLDCAHCTAWLSTEAEVQRIQFTREHYPEVFEELQRRMRLVLDETQRRSAELVPALDAIFTDHTFDRTSHPHSDSTSELCQDR
jgi:3'-phosphoadenosine 5'-phosphosulfate sulfotransferase (PAPS reductase)/FAD synthetase